MFVCTPLPSAPRRSGSSSRGVNDCEVARRLGLPRTTVRDWRAPRYVPHAGGIETCWRCWRASRPARASPADYAELLGLYLGDGHVTQQARTQRLRLFLDAKYPTIVSDAEALLERCFPGNRVERVAAQQGAMVVLRVHHGHLTCLLPQHGPGKKHERRVGLEPWQDDLLRAAPWAFLRGCIRSDGCFFVNRTGRCSYPSYEFCNRSTDLLMLFSDVCEAVGLSPRRYWKHVRICRRADVARMLEHVGVKA